MQQSNAPWKDRVVTQEEAHLIRRLRGLIEIRNRERRLGRWVGLENSAVQENRRLIRDCITRLRYLRAGVSSPWLGLGQRASRRL